jgi:hypothetical protein
MSDQSRILAALGIKETRPIEIIEYESDGLTLEKRVTNWINETNSLYALLWRLRFGGAEDPIFNNPDLEAIFWHRVTVLVERNWEGCYEFVSQSLGFKCDWQTHQYGVNPDGDLVKYHTEKVEGSENKYISQRIR